MEVGRIPLWRSSELKLQFQAWVIRVHEGAFRLDVGVQDGLAFFLVLLHSFPHEGQDCLFQVREGFDYLCVERCAWVLLFH